MKMTLFLLHSFNTIQLYFGSECKDKEKENITLFLTFSQFQHLPLYYAVCCMARARESLSFHCIGQVDNQNQLWDLKEC